MCKYCNNADYDDAAVIYDEKTGNEGRVYADSHMVWFLEVTNTDTQEATSIAINDCPKCGRELWW